MNSAPQPQTADLLVPAILSAAEAQEHRARLLDLLAAGAGHRIEMTETEGCHFPSVVAVQLCLATAASLRSAGLEPDFGPEARRLLGAQKLCEEK